MDTIKPFQIMLGLALSLCSIGACIFIPGFYKLIMVIPFIGGLAILATAGPKIK